MMIIHNFGVLKTQIVQIMKVKIVIKKKVKKDVVLVMAVVV